MEEAFAQINRAISRYVDFTEEELGIFNSLLDHQNVPRKSLLLKAGDVCPFEAFVVRGCLRKYCIDPQGAEVILQFAVEDSWIGDISFNAYDPQPSQVYIETIEASELLLFSPASKEELLRRAPRFERAFRILVQRNLAVTQNRLFNTIAKSGEEKYREFLKAYPSIPLRVPQHYIASFLGMTPEFLSKIRGKMARK